MASSKEIRVKIRSVQNTRKITKAMEMVAASKMRRAQERMQAARPYAEKMDRVIGHLVHAAKNMPHPFLATREPKRVGFIVVTTDRGLCGGLNVNLFRSLINQLQEWQGKGAQCRVVVFGSKGVGFLKRIGANVAAEASHLGDRPHFEQMIGPVKVLLDAYRNGELDRIYVLGNRFVNTMTQQPTVQQVLPRPPALSDGLANQWDYIYEPSAEDLIDQMLMRYVEAQVYQGVVENVACEMAARMVAMKAATDNAGNLIEELQLAYNKARQAAITQELSEIVGGAAAV
ncbi:MAG: F0F1 ATP synthase subunit gamma [Stenotrophobium sp.]